MSAALAATAVHPGRQPRLRRALEEAVEAGASEGERRLQVEEALVQAYLFLGFPAALNGIGLWRQVSGTTAAPADRDDGLIRERRGAELCERIYGGSYPGLRRNIAELHPDLDRWMVEEGYGKVLGRGGLALPDRELCIVATLAVLGTPVQLYSHLRGCLRVGATAEQIEAALQAAAAEAEGLDGGSERVDDAWLTWKRVLERGEG